MEVGKRYREQIVLKVDAQSVSYTMKDVYMKLYDVPRDADEGDKRNQVVMKLWHLLREHERKRGREITVKNFCRGPIDRALWPHLALAVKDIGWRAC